MIVRTQANESISRVLMDYANLQAVGKEYTENKTGPFTASQSFKHGYQHLSPAQLESLNASKLIATPLNQAHIEYLYELYSPSNPSPYAPTFPNESHISLAAAVVAPPSRGNVPLQSNQMSAYPFINLNLAKELGDQQVWIQGFKNLRTVLAQSALEKYTIGPHYGELSLGLSVQMDEEILEFIRQTAYSGWHACCTNSMLPQSQGSVVDSRLRVYGVQNLRVADYSIAPIIVDNHPQAATYMIAEMAAQLIKEDHGW